MTQQNNTKKISMLIPGYHPLTRWLHASLVLGVLFQLLCAAQMAHPDHDEAGNDHAAMEHTNPVSETYTAGKLTHDSAHNDNLPTTERSHATLMPIEQVHANHNNSPFAQDLMSAHRTAGVVVALIVLANLLWAVMLRGDPRKRQMSVLLSTVHWRESISILKQLPTMIIGKRALPEPGNSLSLIVEMLGMLTMTAMAISGSIIWILWDGPGHNVSETAELWMNIHGSFAILLFLYLIGHVSMALLHWRSGDSVFSRILPRI